MITIYNGKPNNFEEKLTKDGKKYLRFGFLSENEPYSVSIFGNEKVAACLAGAIVQIYVGRDRFGSPAILTNVIDSDTGCIVKNVYINE